MPTSALIFILLLIAPKSEAAWPVIDIRETANEAAEAVTTADLSLEILEELTGVAEEVKVLREARDVIKEAKYITQEINGASYELEYLLNYDVNRFDALNSKLRRTLRLIRRTKRFYAKMASFALAGQADKAANINTSSNTGKIYDYLVNKDIKEEAEKQKRKNEEIRAKLETNKRLDKEIKKTQEDSKENFFAQYSPVKIVPAKSDISHSRSHSSTSYWGL